MIKTVISMRKEVEQYDIFKRELGTGKQFNDAVRIIEENMGSEFSQEFDRTLRRHIDEEKEIAIEAECSQCEYFGNE